MKYNRLILIIIIVFIIVSPFKIFAQTVSPEITQPATPSSSIKTKLDKTAALFQEKFATLVAEIEKKSNEVINGYIDNIENSSFVLKSSDGRLINVSYSEISPYIVNLTNNKPENDQQNILNKNDYVVLFGNTLGKDFSANYIYIQNQYSILQGEITNINQTDYSVDIITSEKDNYTIDIESNTQRSIMKLGNYSIEKVGFSKLKIGDKIHLVTIKPDNKSNRISAIRFLIIPQEYFIGQ